MVQKPSVGDPAPLPAPSAAPRIQGPSSPRLDASGADAQALEAYQQRYIGLDEAVLLTSEGVVVRDALPYLGKYRKPLRGADFYKAVGRPDLAQIYLRNRSVIGALNISAAVLFVGGLAAGIAYSVVVGKDGCSSCDPPRENNELQAILVGTGGIFGGAGLLGTILIIIGSYLPQHPVTAPQARKLIDDHNLELKRQLNLSPDARPEPPTMPNRPRLPTFGVAPFAGPQGGGLAVVGRF